MSTIVLDYAPPTPSQSRRVISWAETVALAGAGIALPLLCFAASARRYPGAPEWQRGHWSDYVTLVPSGRVGWPFVPLLFAAMFAMGVALIAPGRAARSWVFRYVIYTGVILSAQYTLIQMIALFDPGSWVSWGLFGAIVAALVATGLSIGGLWVCRHLGRIKLLIWMPVLVVLMVVGAMFWQHTLGFVLLGAMAIAIIAPALTLSAYLRVAALVWKLADVDSRTNAKPRRLVFIGLAWLATYGGAWVIAFQNAIEFYHSLPTKPPDC